MSRAVRGFAIRAALSLVLLLGVLLAVDVDQIVELLGSVRVSVAALLLVLFVADRVLMAAKWWLLLWSRNLGIGLWQAVRAYYVSTAAGLFLPTTLGADTVRVLLLRKSGDSYRIVASIVLERGIGLLCQGCLAALGLALVLRLGLLSDPSIAYLGWILIGLIAVMAVGVSLSFRLARRVARWCAGGGRLQARLGRLADAYGQWHWRQGAVWLFFGLTAIESFAPVLFTYLAAVALRIDVPFVYLLAIVPLVGMLVRLPIPSLGGIGIGEVSFAAFAPLLGIPGAHGMAIALLADILQVASLLPATFMYPLIDGGKVPDPPPPTSSIETSSDPLKANEVAMEAKPRGSAP